MINGYSVLALVTARGGSKGLSRKNIRELAGKPLIAWTIEAARHSQYIDRIVLSSEDAEIIEIASKWGCEVPFTRPSELSLDSTPGVEPVLHAMKVLAKYDYIVLLQPTSPLRSSADIDNCLELCVSQGAPACVSVMEPDKSPYWMFSVDENKKMKPLSSNESLIPRRQELPLVVSLNGAVYVAEWEWLLKNKGFLSEETLAHVMPKEHSIDIDTEYDLLIADVLLRLTKA